MRPRSANNSSIQTIVKMTRRFALWLPILFTGLAAGPAACQATNTQPPKLVVFITVDAMRADYLTRFAPQLTGGLGRLYNGGAVFTNGFQDHAITETAPGHSAIMSGRYPVHTGISANTAGVNDTTVTLVDATGLGASPFRFRGTTLTDWLIAKGPSHPHSFRFQKGSGGDPSHRQIQAARFLVCSEWDFYDEHVLRLRACRSGFAFSTRENCPRAMQAKCGSSYCSRTAPTVSRTAFR